MVVHYYFEEGKEGGWDCLIREEIDSIFHIEGHGDCWQSAFDDMKESYQKAVDYACEEGLPCPNLEFMSEDLHLQTE